MADYIQQICMTGDLQVLIELSKLTNFADLLLVENNNENSISLHYACFYGHINIVKFIHQYVLECGTINWEDLITMKNDDYNTPFHLACLRGYLNIVQYIHQSVINSHSIDIIISKNIYHHSPLYLTSRYEHLDVAKYLLNHGADSTDIDLTETFIYNESFKELIEEYQSISFIKSTSTFD